MPPTASDGDFGFNRWQCQVFVNRRHVEWSSEQVALTDIDLFLLQSHSLVVGLDALCDGRGSQNLPELHRRVYKGGGFARISNP